MILCLPTHVINLVINDNSLEIIYIYIYICFLTHNLEHSYDYQLIMLALPGSVTDLVRGNPSKMHNISGNGFPLTSRRGFVFGF